MARRYATGAAAPRVVARRGVVTLSTAAIVLSGCQADHDSHQQASTPPKPPSQEQVQKIQDTYAHKSYQAMRKRDQKLITSIESGDLLDRDLANIKLSDRLSEPKKAGEFTYPHSKGHPIKSSADEQRLLTVSDYSNAKQNWKNLGLYLRRNHAKTWKRMFTGGMYANDVPEFRSDGGQLKPVAPDASGYAATPKSLPDLVTKALQHPHGHAAHAFGSSQVRKRYSDELTANKKRAADVGTVKRRYRPGSFLIAVQTRAGYLMVGSFTFAETITARSGKSVSFKQKSRKHTLYPGKYRRTTSRYGAMFAAVVPKHGKSTLVSGEERQTDLSVTK